MENMFSISFRKYRDEEKENNLFTLIISIHVEQKLRNSSVVYPQNQEPLGIKNCMNISFQLFLYIIKVK